ncbi:alpha/beta-tubulin-N-acetyltransferase 9 isoform X1 [Podarcis muralis]
MRINQNTVLQGKRVTLVPYTSAHVPKYHEWMKSEELQRLTASEPLSLEQEYEMQRSWREDADKCTFIVLDTDKWSKQTTTEEDCMVGDVNLFLTDSEDPTLGEIEIMIAEASYRGRGFGKEATLIMMSYEPSIAYNRRNIGSCLIPRMTRLGLNTFEAKIGLENEASIGMFKKIHFKEVGVNVIFHEVTLRLIVDEQERQWLLEQTSHVDEQFYNVTKLQNQVCDS